MIVKGTFKEWDWNIARDVLTRNGLQRIECNDGGISSNKNSILGSTKKQNYLLFRLYFHIYVENVIGSVVWSTTDPLFLWASVSNVNVELNPLSSIIPFRRDHIIVNRKYLVIFHPQSEDKGNSITKRINSRCNSQVFIYVFLPAPTCASSQLFSLAVVLWLCLCPVLSFSPILLVFWA